MRLTSSNLLTLLAITTLTDALPSIPNPRSNRPLARRKATYSVVPVDGGSTGGPAATTVTETASTLPPVTETHLSTLLSTIIVTAYETPSTVVVTITATPSPPPSTIASGESTSAPSCSEITTITAAIPQTSEAMTWTSTLSSASTSNTTTTSVTTPAAGISVTTVPLEVITVTASPSSTPYDNGMWHTTYYQPVYETSISSSSPPSSHPATPTPSFYPYPGVVTSS